MALPNTIPELIERLEEENPVRSFNPKRETLEDHLHYAGRLDLIRELRERNEADQRRQS